MTFFDTNGSFRIVIQCHYDLLVGKILYNQSFWLNRYLKVGEASLLTGSRWNPKSSINKGVRKFTLPCQLKFGFLENLRFRNFVARLSTVAVLCKSCATENWMAIFWPFLMKIGYFSAIFWEKFDLLCDLLVHILHFPPLWRSAVLLIAS